jgi:hypothetical protein
MPTDEPKFDLKRIERIARNLYEAMPGAPPIPRIGEFKQWGFVEDNQHYEFCQLIATLIVMNCPPPPVQEPCHGPQDSTCPVCGLGLDIS